MSSFDALGPSDATSVRVKIRVHPSGEHYVRVPKTVRGAIARREGEKKRMVIFIYFKTMTIRARRRPRDRDRVAVYLRVVPIAARVSIDRPTDEPTIESTRIPGENAEGEGTRRTRLGRPGVDAAFTLSRTSVER